MLRLFLLIVAFNVFLASAADRNALTKACNGCRNGDMLSRKTVSYMQPGNGGEKCLWDFSEMTEVASEPNSVYWFSSNDTLFGMTENENLHKFQVLGDTVYYMGHENRTTIFQDSVPAVWMIYPFGYGHKLESDYYFTGRYAQDRDAVMFGKITAEADGIGRLILEKSDTIDDVLRVKFVQDASVRILLNHESVRDTFSPDSLPFYRREIYQWYAMGYRYPLLETQHHFMYNAKKEEVGRYNVSYSCPTFMQELELAADYVNDAVRKSLKSGQYYNDASQQKRISRTTVNAGQDDELISDMVSVASQKNSISIKYHVESDCVQVEVILSDMKGRVYTHIPPYQIGVGISEVVLDISNLSDGEYLLSVIVGGKAFSKKIIRH